jgi:histidinol-phosphate phosphatase family protein
LKHLLVCIDRDGTLIHDSRDHLFLGRDNDWQTQVRILPAVVEGLRLLHAQTKAAIYMITNQSGVAIADYPHLTEERAHEVCRFVLDRLQEQNAPLDGYFLCPHANHDYVATKPEVRFVPELVHDCQCVKPKLGMVFDALKNEGVQPENANVYVIGDRLSDVLTGVNMGGTGILIPFENEPGEEEKVQALPTDSRVHIVPDLLAAAALIVDQT